MKNLLFLALALMVSVSAMAQPKQQSQPQQKNEPSHAPAYKGSDLRSFEAWVTRDLRDDFARLKRDGAKVHGPIKVNFVVEPNGQVVAQRHEDTRSRDKMLDKRVSDAINKVLNKQRWVVKGPGKRQPYSFMLNF